MSEPLTLMLPLMAGLLLGAVFFGGLWWTVRRGLESKSPAAWFFCSLWLRTIMVIAGFYFVSQADWRRLVACLAGFLIVRLSMAWLTRAPGKPASRIAEGGAR